MLKMTLNHTDSAIFFKRKAKLGWGIRANRIVVTAVLVAFSSWFAGGVLAAPTPVNLFSEGPLVEPTSARSYYGSGSGHTISVPNYVRHPKIEVLADRLGAGAVSNAEYESRVYAYVKRNIRTEFRYGLSKGALGALVDQSGTPFDQAHLMVELLREGGLTANYISGDATLTSTQFKDWTGITEAKAACKLLADGGIPGKVNGSSSSTCNISGNVSTALFSHIWVKVGSKSYDPSYKKVVSEAGIDLAAAMGCGTDQSPTCGSQFLTALKVGASSGSEGGMPYWKNLNEDVANAKLTQLATSLETTLKNNHALSSIEEIIGGSVREIELETPAAVLPHSSSAQVATWTNIPDQYRTKLRVQIDGIDKTLFVDEIYGGRLRLFGKMGADVGSVQARRDLALYLEYQILASSDRPDGRTNNDDLFLWVDHPYAADAGGYMDRTIEQRLFGQVSYEDLFSEITSQVTHTEFDVTSRFFFNPITIVHGWGDVTQNTVAHFQDLQTLNMHTLDVVAPANVTHTYQWCGQSTPKTGVQRARVNNGTSAISLKIGCLDLSSPTKSMDWLAQVAKANSLVGRVNKVKISGHHYVGSFSSGGLISAGINVESGFSVTPISALESTRKSAIFSANTMMSRLEGAIAELVGGTFEGGSGVSLLPGANKQGQRLYRLSGSSINPLLDDLDNYNTAQQNLINRYLATNGNYSVILPEDYEIGPFSFGVPYSPFTPQGNQTYAGAMLVSASDGSALAYVLADGYKGASAASDPLGDALKTTEQTDYSLKAEDYFGIDVVQGAVNLSPPSDLVTGAGGFPMALNFQRSYLSGSESVPTRQASTTLVPATQVNPTILNRYLAGRESIGSLGGGWTHNYDISANIGSDVFQALGEDSALDAASTIASLVVLRDLAATPSRPFDAQLAEIFAGNWWGNQLRNNSVVLRLGPQSISFTKLPSGGFNAPPGDSSVLDQTGLPSDFLIRLSGVTTRDFSDITFKWTNGKGAALNFDHASLQLSHPYRGNEIGETRFKPTLWEFPNGMALRFAYEGAGGANPGASHCLSSVTNSVGRRIDFNFDDTIGGNVCKLESVSDENNRTVTFSSTKEHQALFIGSVYGDFDMTVTLPDGAAYVYQYGASTTSSDAPAALNLLEKVFVPSDIIDPFREFSYDQFGSVTASIDALDQSTVVQVGGFPRSLLKQAWSKNALGATSSVVSDLWGSRLASIDPLGRQTEYAYDNARRMVKTTYPGGNKTEYEYDNRHNQTLQRNVPKPGPALASIETSANYPPTCADRKSCNKPTFTTDALGAVTMYQYDASSGQLDKVTYPAVAAGDGEVNLEYVNYTVSDDSLRLLDSVTDPTGVKQCFKYKTDNKYLLWKSIAACQNPSNTAASFETKLTYDSVGNLLEVDGARTATGSQGVVDITKYLWDTNRRLTKVIDALANEKRLFYTADGQLERVASKIGAQWQVSCNDYNQNGLVEREYGPELMQSDVTCPALQAPTSITTYDYDAINRLEMVTRNLAANDGGSRKTKFEYYADNREHKTIRAFGTPLQQDYITNTYHPNGQLHTFKDANGNLSTNEYDRFDRLAKFRLPDPVTSGVSSVTDYEEYKYDANGNVKEHRKRSGNKVVYFYDDLNQLTKKDLPAGEQDVDYTYDLAKRPDKVIVNGFTIDNTYNYSLGGRLSKVSMGGRAIDYEYDRASNRTKIIWPDGFFVEHTFDALNRLDQIQENGVNTAVLADYEYDDLNRATTAIYQNGTSQSWDYEGDSMLDSLSFNIAGSAYDLSQTFDYTQVNQIRSKTNSNDKYLWDGHYNVNRTYAANGLNQLSRAGGIRVEYDANGNLESDRVLDFEYGTENRLLTASGVGLEAVYDYDGTGRRESKTVNGVATHYLYNDQQMIAEYSSASGSAGLVRRYVHGPGIDNPVVVYEGSGTSNKQWLYTDSLGSVVASANSSGQSTATYAYGDYGSPDAESGAIFRYTGQLWDSETGLYYYKARYYSPSLGRFLQTDTIGYDDGPNWYAYVHNDPVNGKDPNGEFGLFGAAVGASFQIYREVKAGSFDGGFKEGFKAVARIGGSAAVGAVTGGFGAIVSAPVKGLVGAQLAKTIASNAGQNAIIGGTATAGGALLVRAVETAVDGGGAYDYFSGAGTAAATGFQSGAISGAFGSLVGDGTASFVEITSFIGDKGTIGSRAAEFAVGAGGVAGSISIEDIFRLFSGDSSDSEQEEELTPACVYLKTKC